MIVLKNIEMDLTPGSIERAIQAVEDFEDHLQSGMQHLIDELLDRGVEIARAELLFSGRPAVDSGALSDSISKGMLNDHEGVITTGVMYAAFVEYGTGAIGSIQSHPEPNGWIYDSNGHGLEGWVYRGSDGQFHRTAGMESRPFMYNTLRDLEQEAEAMGWKVLAEYIA